MEVRRMGVEFFHAEDGRTDKPDEANRRFSQFCERAQKFNNISETSVHHKTLHVLSIHVAVYQNQVIVFNLRA